MRRNGNVCVCRATISLQLLRHDEIAHVTEILPWMAGMDMMGICLFVRRGQRGEVVELLFM